MNFYELLKPEVEKSCSVLAKNYSDAKRKLALLRKREVDARSKLERFEDEQEKLLEASDESLADNVNAFEKFQVSLKKVNANIEALSQATKALSDKIIPAAEKEVADTGQKLANVLAGLCRDNRNLAEGKMNEFIAEIVELYDDYLLAFDRFFAENDLQFVIHDRQLIPTPKHKRLEALAIVGKSPGQREAAMKAPTAPAMPPESTQDAEIPAEGSLIPPGPTLQAPEPQGTLVEAVETTLLTGII